MSHTDVAGLKVDTALYDFINDEVMPGTGVQAAAFWNGFARVVGEFAPRNAELLARRDELQAQIDAWHRAHRNKPVDPAAYEVFLAEIGYLHAGARALRGRHREGG